MPRSDMIINNRTPTGHNKLISAIIRFASHSGDIPSVQKQLRKCQVEKEGNQTESILPNGRWNGWLLSCEIYNANLVFCFYDRGSLVKHEIIMRDKKLTVTRQTRPKMDMCFGGNIKELLQILFQGGLEPIIQCFPAKMHQPLHQSTLPRQNQMYVVVLWKCQCLFHCF